VVKSPFSFGFPMVYHYFPMNHQKNHHETTTHGQPQGCGPPRSPQHLELPVLRGDGRWCRSASQSFLEAAGGAEKLLLKHVKTRLKMPS